MSPAEPGATEGASDRPRLEHRRRISGRGAGAATGLLPLLVLALGCTVARIEPASERELQARRAQEALVRAALQNYYADFSARDWTRFADHFWPGATITTIWQPPGEPVARVDAQTVPEFVARAPLGPDSKPLFEERMTGADIRIHGNLAQAWVRYSARFGDSAAVREWQGIDAITLLRHEGRWRISSLAFTSVEPGQSVELEREGPPLAAAPRPR